MEKLTRYLEKEVAHIRSGVKPPWQRLNKIKKKAEVLNNEYTEWIRYSGVIGDVLSEENYLQSLQNEAAQLAQQVTIFYAFFIAEKLGFITIDITFRF